MDGEVYKKAIRTFEAKDRETLENDVNIFLESHPNAEPSIWKDVNNQWCASIIYKELIKPENYTKSNGFIDLQF